jgi:FtsP/CotA-like multicopper oxidase with cupredoxin domain
VGALRRTAGKRTLNRKEFLGLAGMSAGALALGGCGVLSAGSGEKLPGVPRAKGTGEIRDHTLVAAPLELEVGDRVLSTWGYEGGVPGPEIRVGEGDNLRVRLRNELPANTTIHWHGLPVENAMDGVPGLTQDAIRPDEEFVYKFTVPTAGTYMYHSHVGLQPDRGLYGPLIVEPKKEELDYDREYTLALDDWLDGAPGTPEEAFEKLRNSSDGGMMMGGGMMEAGDLSYPLYLVNGRPPEDPETLGVRKGEKIRLRLMNPAADTTFRFAAAGHKLTITHADGQPVEPVEVDAVRMGMGERYDVLIEANNPGVWQLAAVPEGKSGLARALLRYEESGGESPPPADSIPRELRGRLLSYADLKSSGGQPFPEDGLIGGPDRVRELALSGGHGGYVWAIDGQLYPDAEPLEVHEGEWVRFELQNNSTLPPIYETLRA